MLKNLPKITSHIQIHYITLHPGLEEVLFTPLSLPVIPALPHHRSGRRLHADGAWHDDAVPDHHLHAVQTLAVRAGRWLGADDGQPGRLVRDMRYSDPFGLSLSKPSAERSEARPSTSLRSVMPFDFAQGERT